MTKLDDWETNWENLHRATNYEPARRWRREVIIELLELRGNERILDLGAGKGDLIRDLKRASDDFSFGATEFSSSGLNMIRSENSDLISAKVNLEKSLDLSQKRYLSEGGNWDVVVCSEVLEHLDNTAQALQIIRELSNSETRIVITVPAGPIAAVDKAFGHRRHYSKCDLTKLLESEGFSVTRFECLGFPFFNLYRLGLVIGGKRVLDSIEKFSVAEPDRFSRLLLYVFSFLFRFNRKKGNLGWQLVAICFKN